LVTPSGGELGGGEAEFTRGQFLSPLGGALGGGEAGFAYFYKTFLFLYTHYELHIPGVLIATQEPIIAPALNFPSIFCILQTPGIEFVLKPTAERFDIL
jgi:hypothetical protein